MIRKLLPKNLLFNKWRLLAGPFLAFFGAGIVCLYLLFTSSRILLSKKIGDSSIVQINQKDGRWYEKSTKIDICNVIIFIKYYNLLPSITETEKGGGFPPVRLQSGVRSEKRQILARLRKFDFIITW